jgi:type IV secretory pathway VirB10-like protein
MTRWKLGIGLALGALLAACQAAPEKNAAEPQKSQDLEKRVAELERKATPSPSPEATAQPQPAWEAQMPSAPARASQPPRASAPSRATTSVRAHEAPASRRTTAANRGAEPVVTSRNEAPSDRVTTRPEPVERPGQTAEPGTVRVWRDDEERAERINIPAGTQLSLVLETPVSSATSRPGDRVTARVERATAEDGRVLLPGGTVLKGRVLDAHESGRVSGRARVAIAFDQIVVRGRTQRLDTTEIEAVAADSHERDAAIIGGGTAAGAIIGGIAGGGRGAGKGAIIGGIAGTGAVLATKGKEIELPAGSRWTVRLKDGVKF